MLVIPYKMHLNHSFFVISRYYLHFEKTHVCQYIRVGVVLEIRKIYKNELNIPNAQFAHTDFQYALARFTLLGAQDSNTPSSPSHQAV